MRWILFCLLLMFQFSFRSTLIAQNGRLKVAKEPVWITVNKIDYNSTTALENEAEDGYFDLAFEKQVSLTSQSQYFKKTIKILSEAGVQNSSEIAVNFHPAYEQLTFHTIQIIRNGKKLSKLQLSNFRTIQQEKGLGKHLYDGSLTALLVLDDVRKGDILESSYTIQGFNPILYDKYSDTYDLGYAVPVGSIYYKLLVPAGRNIIFKNNRSSIVPVITPLHNETMYEWRVDDVPSLHLEKKTPEWFHPYADVMVSEYKNWNEVTNWASTLFNRNINATPALQKKINSIRENNPTNETRVLAALHFVQDDVRYMGIEMGASSHKPSDPNRIFAQRFGDCKDKSYLLVTILNGLAIEANPVLVNTTAKKTIREQLPAATAFDHCVVQVAMNGKEYWFDPTISFQRGSIKNISFPNYQAGLVIKPSTQSISDIPNQVTGQTDIKEIFTVPDRLGKAYLKVITTTTGSFADEARSDYNNNSVYEMKHKYKDFYAAYFDKIIADSLQYKSDDTNGSFTTTEYYTINDIWKTEGDMRKIVFLPYVINSIMAKPTDKNRSMPFSLVYPARFKEEIVINMPEEWPIKEYSQIVACAGFSLHASAQCTGSIVSLKYEYENLQDHIMPNEAARFFANYDKALAASGYELSYKPGSIVSYNSSPVVSLLGLRTFPKLYLMLGITVLITILLKRQSQKQF